MGVYSNNTTIGHMSTLLIPERIVWLPYASLVMTVVIWLGSDFYRFHGKNREKYARQKELLTILRAVPSRQRISMVSGIGLRFRRGKPILGDVWNTSPSSSDVSSCCAPRRREQMLAYTREVTPSDEGGEYSETDLFAGSRTASCADLVRNEVHNTPRRDWQVGKEYVRDNSAHVHIDGSENDGGSGMKSNDNILKNGMGQNAIVINTEKAPSPPFTTTISFTDRGDSKHHPTGAMTAGVGGGVDDGGGGCCSCGSKKQSLDACTQTSFCEFTVCVTPDYTEEDPLQEHTRINHRQMPRSAGPSPRLQRNSVIAESLYHSVESLDQAPQFFTDYLSARPSISVARPADLATSSTLPRYSSGRIKKKPPPLRLDLMAAPYSPTSEIVATKHGFTVEGLEVPHYSGGGGRSIPSTENEIFKPRKSSSASFIKPLNPSPAVASRVAGSHRHSISRSSIQASQALSRHPQHHRQRKPDASLDSKPTRHPSQKQLSPLSKQTSGGHPGSSKQFRSVSSSPRMIKEYDESGEVVSMKVLKDSSGKEPPQSAPIPSHLYHQDEEGFFASITSSASHGSRMYHGDRDYSNKGMLFLSRLAGVGRQHDQGAMGGGYRANSGGYRSGGFES